MWFDDRICFLKCQTFHTSLCRLCWGCTLESFDCYGTPPVTGYPSWSQIEEKTSYAYSFKHKYKCWILENSCKLQININSKLRAYSIYALFDYYKLIISPGKGSPAKVWHLRQIFRKFARQKWCKARFRIVIHVCCPILARIHFGFPCTCVPTVYRNLHIQDIHVWFVYVIYIEKRCDPSTFSWNGRRSLVSLNQNYLACLLFFAYTEYLQVWLVLSLILPPRLP